MNAKDKNLQGFTLVEMIVSTAIIAIVSSVVVANYGQLRKSGDVVMAAQLFASEVRTEQSNAINLKNFKNTGQPPSGGWGIDINMALSVNEYTVFGDIDSDSQYSGPAESARIETLPKNIEFNSITFQDGASTEANILFIPPDPDTVLTHTGAGQEWVRVELIDRSSQRTKVVEINEYGLVDVQD